MKYVVALAVVIAAAGCAKGPEPVELSRTAYTNCLSGKPVEQCQNERARLDADLAVADAQSRRRASTPPLVLSSWEPPPVTPVYRPALTCATYLGITTCN